ncbi:MAG: hypothetical protein NTW95_14665, partial [Candidatus Aminicenantes bacterium]|nr:hypothetical protein [Candidatus Aminicenantes bacterium]
LAPGMYTVEWELVREGSFWGRSKNWRPSFLSLSLRPLVSAAFKKAWLPTCYASGRKWLDREQYLLRQTLKNNEAWHEGKLFGFSAGTDYPQVWIRDTATLMFYARFFYTSGQLQEMIGHFLSRQSPEGEICDWVDTTGRSDKNTVESDQESSLVLAAYWLALDDPAWLNGQVNGIPRLRRLDLALDWLWRNRRDARRGLIWSGFTADWGDVERSYADQRAVDLSDRSRRTYSIYAQALFIQAAHKMTMIAGCMNDATLAGKWRQREKVVAAACRQQLFLPEQGYFLVHRLEGKEEFLTMEEEILAIGGNAEAMRAGLMSRSEIERFIKVLEERKKQFGLRSVSFTLLPPYPRDFFPHPLLSPWSYQNGGEWDWIGGRMVAALYQAGFRNEAEAYLKEIVVKNLRDNNIFEWSDRAGNGQGASFYAGAAGVLGEAVLRGQLGLEEDFDCYSFAVNGDRFKIDVHKAGDSFSFESSDRLTVDIASLSKKEICLQITPNKKPICISKKGRSIVFNDK